MTRLARVRVSPKYRLIDILSGLRPVAGTIAVTDGITAPATVSGSAVLYVDEADNSLKVKFGNGTVKTVATNP